jgi:hypothetical protein
LGKNFASLAILLLLAKPSERELTLGLVRYSNSHPATVLKPIPQCLLAGVLEIRFPFFFLIGDHLVERHRRAEFVTLSWRHQAVRNCSSLGHFDYAMMKSGITILEVE